MTGWCPKRCGSSNSWKSLGETSHECHQSSPGASIYRPLHIDDFVFPNHWCRRLSLVFGHLELHHRGKSDRRMHPGSHRFCRSLLECLLYCLLHHEMFHSRKGVPIQYKVLQRYPGEQTKTRGMDGRDHSNSRLQGELAGGIDAHPQVMYDITRSLRQEVGCHLQHRPL